MKKSIKRFLVLTQVLGWSALVATACTDNDKPVSKTADVKSDSSKTAADKHSEGQKAGPTSQGSTEHSEGQKAGPTSQGSTEHSEGQKAGPTSQG